MGEKTLMWTCLEEVNVNSCADLDEIFLKLKRKLDKYLEFNWLIATKIIFQNWSGRRARKFTYLVESCYHWFHIVLPIVLLSLISYCVANSLVTTDFVVSCQWSCYHWFHIVLLMSCYHWFHIVLLMSCYHWFHIVLLIYFYSALCPLLLNVCKHCLMAGINLCCVASEETSLNVCGKFVCCKRSE